jgi:hypothetical protein
VLHTSVVFKKLPKINNFSLGENSTNRVTLSVARVREKSEPLRQLQQVNFLDAALCKQISEKEEEEEEKPLSK